MSQRDEVPFGASEFAENPGPRCLLVDFHTPDLLHLPLLDTSSDTPMGVVIRRRNDACKANRRSCSRPKQPVTLRPSGWAQV